MLTIFTTFIFLVTFIFLLNFSSTNLVTFGYQEYAFVQNCARNNDTHKVSEIHDVLATKDFVFVPDYENHNIKKFTKNGTLVSEW